MMRVIAITTRNDNDVFYLDLFCGHYSVPCKDRMGKREEMLGGESIFLVNNRGVGHTFFPYSCSYPAGTHAHSEIPEVTF